MNLLINITDIGKYREVSKGLSTDKIKPFIREAQEIDLRGHICRKFWDDLMLNWQGANYQELLTGTTYEYEDYTYSFEGLKAVLSYYAFSRLIMFGNAVSTPFDMVQKTNEWSDPISTAQRRDMHKECRQIAARYWEDCKHYLKAKEDDFPIWSECNCHTPNRLKVEKI